MPSRTAGPAGPIWIGLPAAATCRNDLRQGSTNVGARHRHADHKISKSPERKSYALKTIVSLCVGWCSLSASFEPYVKPPPERDLIKWGIMTTRGCL
jgi:hypothetical protein